MKHIDIDIGLYDSYTFKQQTPIFEFENNATTIRMTVASEFTQYSFAMLFQLNDGATSYG